MGRIGRLVFLETLAEFAACLAVSTLALTLCMGAQEAVRRGLPLDVILRASLLVAPETLRFTIPGCVLFASCSTFARWSASNELLALQSVGISPFRVVWPVLLLAVLLSLATFCMYEICAAWSRPVVRELFFRSMERVVCGSLKNEGTFATNQAKIIVSDVEGNTLYNPVFLAQATPDRPAVEVVAERAVLNLNWKNKSIKIDFENGNMQVDGNGAFYFSDSFQYETAIPGWSELDENYVSPAALRGSSIQSQIDHERRTIQQLDEALSEQPPSSEAANRQESEQKREHHLRRLFRLQAEPQRRLANGFACLVFVLLGLPVAIKMGPEGNLAVFFVCFLPILMLYYPLLMLGETVAREGFAPQYSVWLANATFTPVGIFFMHKWMHRA